MKTRLLLPALFIFTAAMSWSADPEQGLAVHEWGTFTSVQGSDGVQMVWNPYTPAELPKFVYDRGGPKVNGVSITLTKSAFVTRQRMETPVLYFYSDRELTADVSVHFPQGIITEWYPDKSAADPSQIMPGMLDASKVPALHWKNVRVLPRAAKGDVLLKDESGSHYYAARETDASLLRTTTDKKTETEKFLFYRGVGNFSAPLIVKPVGNAGRLTLRNAGAEELADLFVYQVDANGRLSWTPVAKLASGESRDVEVLQATGSGAESLSAALRSALVRAGLYEKEAAAMVKTWEGSWFSERGVRVLYTLPRAWADRTLPLTVAPTPKAIERVMVGRAEIITPQMEAALRGQVDRYIAAKPEERAKIVAETRALGFGRFSEAVLSRVRNGDHTQEYFQRSWELVEATRSVPQPAAKL